MGARRSKIAALLLLLAAFLVAPTAAVAAEEPETNGIESFSLKASNGYSMVVYARWEPGYGEKTGQIFVYLRRGNAATAYVAPAKVTYTELEADLGELGRIAVKVNRSKAEAKTTVDCRPKEEISYYKDSYVGEIEFHGEEGYADVSRTHARFSFHPFLDWFLCGLSLEDEVGRGPGAQLKAIARLGKGERTTLQVNQNRPGARVKLEAGVVERRGPIQIFRGVKRTLPGTAFGFDSDLRSASLEMPGSALLSGSGLFRRGASPANRWTGNLSADFPGRSNVPLTGSRFRTSLVHAHWTMEPPEFR